MPQRATSVEEPQTAAPRVARTPAPQADVSAPTWMSPAGARVPSAPGGAADVRVLQRLAGNQAVMRMLDAKRPDHPLAGPITAVQALRDDELDDEDIQRAAGDLREPSDEAIRSAAAEGVRTPSTTLPYLDRIQASFGRHSIAHVQAHVGPEAAQASRAMNALAYASGTHVVFGATPDLRTAAHEAAHIVQQQAGVQLSGGIGRAGDPYERNADEVADAVVAGRSAEELLLPFNGQGAPAVIQRKIGFEFETNTYLFTGKYGQALYQIEDDEVCYRAPKWKIVGDSGRMEFVSDPLDLDDFEPVVNQMQMFIANAVNARHDQDVREVIGPGAQGNWEIPMVWIRPPRVARDSTGTQNVTARSLYGNPQVSVGIELSKLARFLKATTTDRPLRNLRPRGKGEDAGRIIGPIKGKMVKDAAAIVERILADNLPPDSKKSDFNRLKGLWLLMASYLSWLSGWDGKGYIKAQFTLMARTDFHAMYKALTPVEKTAYQDLCTKFLKNFDQGGQPIPHVEFTVEKWYQSVSGVGSVQRPAFNNPGVNKHVDLMSDPETVAKRSSISMGQMEIDTDQGGEKVVLELRRITNGGIIPITHMRSLVLAHIYNWLAMSKLL